ncbi:hydrogenase, partial [Salmonella enterica subsp. enterica serovar 4,12:i:-]
MLAERQRTRKSALCPWRSVV